MINREFFLLRDCVVTAVPGGDWITLAKGTPVVVKQALGGTVTVRSDMGLFRIGTKDLDVLGDEAASLAEAENASSSLDFDPQSLSEDHVWDALKGCFDPEIPINIVDLGLIYDLRLEPIDDAAKDIFVKMTLTARGCGMGPAIAADAKGKIEELPGVRTATVDIVWEPEWNPHMISDLGRIQLGIN